VAEIPAQPESVLDPLFSDPSLWPLLTVAVLSMSAFGAALVELTFADRNLFAMAGLAMLAGVSIFLGDSEYRRTRRLRVPGVIAVLWLLSFGMGFAYLRAFPDPQGEAVRSGRRMPPVDGPVSPLG